ncbi:MAG: IclR family transcriptional regulator [bacterium]
MPATKTPTVPALERGLNLLEVIARSRSGLTFSQLARSFDFPKSSIHCLLITFERLGYLHRSKSTGRYVCGTQLVRLANLALDGFAIREEAAPLLRELAEHTGLTAHLAILEGNEAMLVGKVSLIGGQHVPTWVGKRIDVHCTSLGKSLIAYLPEPQVDEIIRQRGLLRHNENTISSAKKLKDDLTATRLRGYAIDDQEKEIGMRCIGVPVFQAGGRVVAAVSVSGRIADIDVETSPEILAALRDTAQALARRLDWFAIAAT